MSTKYELKNNEIHRDGVKIASRDPQSGQIDYLPDMDRYRAPVSEFIKKSGLDKPPAIPPEVLARMSKPRSAGENINQVEATTIPPVDPEPVTETRAAGHSVVLQASPEPSGIEARLAALEAENARLRAAVAQPAQVVMQPVAQGQQHANQIEHARAMGEQVVLNGYLAEGAPKLDPQLGDKTPAFVLWLCKHHPDQARQRYANRRVSGAQSIEDLINNK